MRQVLVRPRPTPRDRAARRAARRPTPTPVRLVVSLAALEVVGTLLLSLPGIGVTRRLHLNEAAFMSMSALSCTGLATVNPATDLTPFGQICVTLLVQIGGVGWTVISVLVLRLLGRRISLTDRLALRDSLELVSGRAIVALTQRVLLIVLLIEAAGAALLWLRWRGEMGDGRAAYLAVLNSVVAFCNAGFDFFTGTSDYPAGLPTDGLTLGILGTLIVLGGLGIPVVYELLTYVRRRRFSLHTRITLTLVAGLIVFGAAALLLGEGQGGGTYADEPLPRQVALATFQSVSSRTAGFAATPDFAAISPASRLTLIALMFVGPAPASMGGGITTGTLAVLLLALTAYARNATVAQVGGRSIAPGSVRKATAIFVTSVILVLLTTWLVLLTHDAPLDVVLFEVVSAFSTCGLSLGFTTQLNPFGQIIIGLLMFWGRLGALTLVTALAQYPAEPRVKYPEENILIG